jgi:hypothetical protein
MAGAVTVVRWRGSERHIWVPVRPPPVRLKGEGKALALAIGGGTCSDLFHVLLMQDPLLFLNISVQRDVTVYQPCEHSR